LDNGGGDCGIHSRLLKYIYQANGIPSRIAYGTIYDDRKFDQIYSEWEAQFPTAHIPKTFYFQNTHGRLEAYTESLGWIFVEATAKDGYGILESPYWSKKPFFTRTYEIPKW